MHSEHFYIKQEDADKINNAKKNGKRVIAVGTTSCRVLETIADENGMVKPTEGDTQIFIYPGYKYKWLSNEFPSTRININNVSICISW